MFRKLLAASVFCFAAAATQNAYSQPNDPNQPRRDPNRQPTLTDPNTRNQGATNPNTGAQHGGRTGDRATTGDDAQARMTVVDIWYRPATRWQKATDLIGKPVRNAQGEGLGEIAELAIDPSNGRVIYGVLAFGGFMGLGEKYFAIPWSALRLSQDYGHVVLLIDRERLDAARGFDKGGTWPNFGDQRWAEETYRHYGQSPYWGAGQDETLKPTTAWQKASDLMSKSVRSRAGEELGDLENLAVDPDNGRVLYGIVDFGDWMEGEELYAIPWGALSMSAGYEHITINMDKEPLRKAPRFTDNQWPNLADQRWARETYTFYQVPTYWDRNNRGAGGDAGDRDMNRGNRDNSTDPNRR